MLDNPNPTEFNGHEMAPGDLAAFDLAPDPEPVRPRYFHFVLAGSPFAFPVENVVEADRPLPVTPLPFVPEWILGIANLRGDILSIVDLRAFLGLARPRLRPEDRLVVVKSLKEDLQVGLVIDRIDGIHPLEDQLDSLEVLDIEHLLLSPEMRQFDTARFEDKPNLETELQTGD